MKKVILFFAVTVLFFSNAFAEQNLHEGAWVDGETEMTSQTIVKEQNSFWMNGKFGKHEIIKAKTSYVILDKKEFSIEFDRNDDCLIFQGVKYIPEFKSKKRQFAGRWSSLNKETVFDIKINNGGVLWDIIKNDGQPIRFYPKLTDKGFTFTIGDYQLYFTIVDGIMTDSIGNKYIQILSV